MSTFEITMDAAVLREALSASVCRRSTEVIREHVLLDASKPDTVVITSMDGILTRTVTVACGHKQAGKVTAHADMMRRVLVGLGGEVVIKSGKNNEQLVLTQGKRRFSIPSLPADGFPVADAMEAQALEFDPVAVKGALDHVSYCMAKLDHRIYLNGVIIEPDHIMAADGHRLAVCAMKTGLPVAQIILPRDAVAAVSAMLEEGVRALLLTPKGHSKPAALELYTDTMRLRTTLIDSLFTGWDRAIHVPDGDRYRVTVASGELIPAIERVAAITFSVEKARGIRVRVANAALALEACGPLAANDDIACQLDGPEPDLGIESKYLLEVAKLARGEALTMTGCGANTVHKFTIEGRDDEHYIMPMRL